MSISAIIMLLFSCVLVWGGFVGSLILMNKKKCPWELEEQEHTMSEQKSK